jgi:hypothetical protein
LAVEPFFIHLGKILEVKEERRGKAFPVEGIDSPDPGGT